MQMKRFISAIIGMILIGIVIILGIKSADSNTYLIMFGVASAIVAPVGLSALGYSIKKEDAALKKLAMVPEIGSLIEKAETEKEKIKRLNRERIELINYIKIESQRTAFLERKKMLETEAVRISNEYRTVLKELEIIGYVEVNKEKISPEIEHLYEIVEYIHDKGNTNSSNTIELGILAVSHIISSISDVYLSPIVTITDILERQIMSLLNNIFTKSKKK